MENLTGKSFGGYEIRELIKTGGMAAVYKAAAATSNRVVAVKILPREVAADPQYTVRFARETALLTSMRHAHIVEILDSGQSDGYTYLVMPLITGGTLGDLMGTGKLLGIDRVLGIVDEIGDALEYVHSRGVVHRDLKPSNVLLDQDGTCFLSDFGIARIMEATGSFTTGFIGTPGYASPEQIKGDVIDRRCDVYSLGVMLFELLTGSRPFVADSELAIVLKHLHDPVPSLRNRNPTVPEAVEQVVMRALAKRAADRQATAHDLQLALREAFSAQPIPSLRSRSPSVSPAGETSTVKISQTTTVPVHDLAPAERARLLAYLDQDNACVSLWKLHNRHIGVERKVDHVDYAVKGNSIFAEIILAWNAGYPRLTIDDLLERIDAAIHVEEWANVSSIAESLCQPGPMNFFLFAGQWGYAINYPVLREFSTSPKSHEWRVSYTGLMGTIIPDLREPDTGMEARWTSLMGTMAELLRVHIDGTKAFNDGRHREVIDETTRALGLIDAVYEVRPGLYGLLCEYAFKFTALRGMALYADGDTKGGWADLNKALNFDPECYDSEDARGKLIETMGRRSGQRSPS